MTAVSDWIAQISADRRQVSVQSIVGTYDNVAAALAELNTGSFASVNAWIAQLAALKNSSAIVPILITWDVAVPALLDLNKAADSDATYSWIEKIIANCGQLSVTELVGESNTVVQALTDLSA